ncbi:MAG: hypothetical protein R6U01_14560 [Halorubrum sp.]|uniref:DUF7563 family protein n=1 Tax=Halorubrum sp. TaxID=1879286 RepID=UPI003970EE5D
MKETATDVNRRCNRCGSAVSRRFVRVFGMGDTVRGCLDCLPRNRLSSGDAARREDAPREQSLRAP